MWIVAPDFSILNTTAVWPREVAPFDNIWRMESCHCIVRTKCVVDRKMAMEEDRKQQRMKHGITRRILGDDTFLEISENEYAEIAKAKSSLIHALHVEEKFDIVLQNYADVERELLSRALGNVLSGPAGWSESIGRLQVFNRRMINLLTTCRLYLDQVIHNIREIFGDDSQVEAELKAETKKEYEKYFGYRVLEAMRNYVQHRGFPIHRVVLNANRIEEGDQFAIRHVVIPQIDVREVGKDKKFKVSVLKEMEPQGRYIDVRPLVRQYIASIGRIHDCARKRLEDRLTSDESTLTKADADYKQIGGQDSVGLAAVQLDYNGQTVDYIEIFDDFIERRKELMRRNRNVTHYGLHFVTNAVHP